jgi:hypothetical protein
MCGALAAEVVVGACIPCELSFGPPALNDAGIRFSTLDAAQDRSYIAALGITTAPALLRVGESGQIDDREHRNFSEDRLLALASGP